MFDSVVLHPILMSEILVQKSCADLPALLEVSQFNLLLLLDLLHEIVLDYRVPVGCVEKYPGKEKPQYYGSKIKWFLYSMGPHPKQEPFHSAPVILQ